MSGPLNPSRAEVREWIAAIEVQLPPAALSARMALSCLSLALEQSRVSVVVLARELARAQLPAVK